MPTIARGGASTSPHRTAAAARGSDAPGAGRRHAAVARAQTWLDGTRAWLLAHPLTGAEKILPREYERRPYSNDDGGFDRRLSRDRDTRCRRAARLAAGHDPRARP